MKRMKQAMSVSSTLVLTLLLISCGGSGGTSNGIGTHQIALMPDGKRIVAANGGILTHPSTPRKKLNLDTMKPSLTYIDCESGKHLESYFPQHHQMSIRHIDVAADDTVG